MNKNLKTIIESRWVKILLLVLVAAAVVFQIRESSVDSEQVYVVDQHDVAQLVLLSGEVRAVGQIDLSFDASGKIATTTVSQGDVVHKGDILAELDYETLRADLLQAQGNLQSTQSSAALAQASVQKTEANLALALAQNRGIDSSIEAAEIALLNTIVEQETLVQNAYNDLLNNDLTAYPVDNYRNVVSPVISGSYIGSDVGEYMLDFYRSGGTTGYSIRVSGLTDGIVSLGDYGIPSLLGTHGLYITLPESGDGDAYGNSDWIIPIPNNRSSTYQTKLGAYEKAQQTQALAVAKVQATLDALIAQQESGESVAITTAQEQQALASVQEAKANLNQVYGALTQAQAGVAKVQAQIDNSIIFAPFDGTVARLSFEVGQSVVPGYVGITIVTAGDYELVMNIPEIDVAKVHVGNLAEIILDAYGTSVVWSGVLSEIELVETRVDGVPVYASVVTISNPDDRIKIGMNARAKIVVEERVNVIAIPASYLITKNDSSIVLVKIDERQTEERVVTTGITGTDYFVEILDGLIAGETILSPTDK